MEERQKVNFSEFITKEANNLNIKEICLEQIQSGYYRVKEDAFVELQKRGFTPIMIYEALVFRYYLDENFVTNEIVEDYKKYLNNISIWNQQIIPYLESQINKTNFSMIGTAVFSLLVSCGLATSNIENNEINDWPNAVYTYITLFNFYKAHKSVNYIEKTIQKIQEAKNISRLLPKP